MKKINIGRPTFTSKEDLDKEQQFIDYIESKENIKTSDAYQFIKEYVKNREFYVGSGFQYYFWFEDENDIPEFIDKVNELFSIDKSKLLIEE